MSAVFDTLKFARQLKDAGVSEQQAEAEAQAIQGAFAEALDTQVATKTDIAAVKIEIVTLATELRAEMREMEARLKADILKWMFGALLGQAAVIVALVKLL